MKIKFSTIRRLLTVVLTIVSLPSLAQKSEVTVHQDGRLAVLENYRKMKADSSFDQKWQKVYRVLICTVQDKNQAYQAKAAMLQQFPRQELYLSYQSPYFRLKAGDFATEEKARRFLQKLPDALKNKASVVPDIKIL